MLNVILLSVVVHIALLMSVAQLNANRMNVVYLKVILLSVIIIIVVLLILFMLYANLLNVITLLFSMSSCRMSFF
jgi:hypothetical protein